MLASVYACISMCVRMRMCEMGTLLFSYSLHFFGVRWRRGGGQARVSFSFCALPFSQLENRHEKECKKLTTAAAAQRGHWADFSLLLFF